MDATVEAAIIGAAATVVAAAIGVTFKFRKHPQQKESRSQDILSNIGSISDSVINVNSPQADLQKIPVKGEEGARTSERSITDQLVGDLTELRKREGKPITDLTHKEICNAIESAPPFHQSKIHDSFIGRRVVWEAELSSIRHHEDSTMIFGDMRGNVFLTCHSDLGSGDVFISAAKGTSFQVAGEIKSISRYEVVLKNCSYQLIKKNSQV